MSLKDTVVFSHVGPSFLKLLRQEFPGNALIITQQTTGS